MKQFILNLIDFAIKEFGIIDDVVKQEINEKVNKKVKDKLAEIDVDKIIDSIDFDKIITDSLESKANYYLKNSADSIFQTIFENIRYNDTIKAAYKKTVVDKIVNAVKE